MQNNNPELKKVITANNNLKDMLVQHVGDKLSPKDNNVTMEMVIDVVADEFPEFVMTLAEENWIRGYEQGLADVDSGMLLMEQESEKKKSCKLCEE